MSPYYSHMRQCERSQSKCFYVYTDYWLYLQCHDGVYLDVADDDDEEREEEDLSVDDSMIDGMPGLSVYSAQNVFRLVCF